MRRTDDIGLLVAAGATVAFAGLAWRSFARRIITAGSVDLKAGRAYRFTLQTFAPADLDAYEAPARSALVALGATDIHVWRRETDGFVLSFVRVSPIDTTVTIGQLPFLSPALTGAVLRSVQPL